MRTGDRRLSAQVLRDFIIFFAVLFFTCTVGIIELLPEFDKIGLWTFGWIVISVLYFGLVLGIVFSIDKCFWLYEQNRSLEEFGFNFPEIEPFYPKGKRIKRLLIIGVLLIFTLLYLVKIRVLQ